MENRESEKHISLFDENTIDQLCSVFRSFGVVVAYLYGSFARYQQTPLSDIDIAILMKKSSTSIEKHNVSLRIGHAISEIVKGVEIDIRVLNNASLNHKYNVIRDGKILFSDDDFERIAFESRALMEYFDFKPFIDQYNQYMYRRIEETGKI